MSNNILRFADLGESATRRILAGWCGPLVPEPPTDKHDHRKHRLMYMDCTSPETLEGHVLTFTYSQWSRGTELVFGDGTPRGVGADVAVGRRVLSWETCWKWIQGAGMDCARPEVATHLAATCARVCLQHVGINDMPIAVYVFDDWVRCGLEVYLSTSDRCRQRYFCWDGQDGGGNEHFISGRKVDLFDLPTNVVARAQPDAASFLAALALHLAPQIAALS